MEHWVTRGVEEGELLPRGRWWLDSSGAVRCRGWPSQRPFELQTAGGMCLVSRSLFFFFIPLKGWAWRVKLMLIVLDVLECDWDLPVIMTNPLSIFTNSKPDSSSLSWWNKCSSKLRTGFKKDIDSREDLQYSHKNRFKLCNQDLTLRISCWI